MKARQRCSVFIKSDLKNSFGTGVRRFSVEIKEIKEHCLLRKIQICFNNCKVLFSA
jgi:hypothetical protein